MGRGATDIPEGIMAVSNNRDRTSQYKLELVVPESQDTQRPANVRWGERGRGLTRSELVDNTFRQSPRRHPDGWTPGSRFDKQPNERVS
jgi:hypothetical protein